MLWFAWKYLPLWYQQQRHKIMNRLEIVVICLKISTFVVSTTTDEDFQRFTALLWFAWKYLPLWYQQQRWLAAGKDKACCDLLENIYLCGINNNTADYVIDVSAVVICLKISTFVVSTTTGTRSIHISLSLWFAWKYLPLWYQQQPRLSCPSSSHSCDLLENIYLCGINNNKTNWIETIFMLWFAWKYLPLWYQQQLILCNLLFIKMI